MQASPARTEENVWMTVKEDIIVNVLRIGRARTANCQNVSSLITSQFTNQDRFPLSKINIGSDRTGLFFHLVLSTPPDQKKVEKTSTIYYPGCGSQVQTGIEN